MPKKRKNDRIYWRSRGSDVRRAYADFRDYADVGGKREPLKVSGAKLATDDSDVARELAANRIKDLEERRRGNGILGPVVETRKLKEFASHHLIRKAKSGKVTEAWLVKNETFLSRAAEFFGKDRRLHAITVADVTAWLEHEQTRTGRGGRSTLSPGTVRHHLNALSNMYRRAMSEGVVQFNPAQAMMEKPSAEVHEARWLEVPDATLILEAARLHKPAREDGIASAHPLIATFLLTGGRQAEVLGLEVSDVSLARKKVTFRPNDWRGLKTKTSHRTIPIWPQLAEILAEYLDGDGRPKGKLLFPSMRGAEESMIKDVRKLLDGLALLVTPEGEEPPFLRTRMFRHTYCAARLQTLDGGAPVSTFTVAKELGHGGTSLVQRVYGHLGTVRHRGAAVEYRVEQHKGLKRKVAAMRKRVRRS